MKKVISLLLVALLVLGCFAGCAKNVTIECTCDCNAQAGGGSTEYTTLKANGNSGVDCSNMPSDTAGILKLFNDVANATKAVPNQKVAKTDPGASTDITALATGGKPAGDGTMNTVKGLVKNFAPAGVTANYAFTNGVDAAVKDDDGKDSQLKDFLNNVVAEWSQQAKKYKAKGDIINLMLKDGENILRDDNNLKVELSGGEDMLDVEIID